MSGGYRPKMAILLKMEDEMQDQLAQAKTDIETYANLQPQPNDSQVLKDTKEQIRMIMDDSFLRLRNQVRDMMLKGKHLT